MKIPKRNIEITEFEDKTFKMNGRSWELDNLNIEELEETFLLWKQDKLEPIQPIPKMIKEGVN